VIAFSSCIHFSCIAFTVLVAFILHFLQLAGITGLGGSFLLHKYRVYGVLFSSFYIILPVLLAVVGGVILFISGCIGCVVLCIFSSLCGLDVDLAPLKDVFQNYSDCFTVLLQLRCCGVKNYTDCCCNKNYHSCSGTLDSPQLLYNEVQTLITFEQPF
uniref:Tetraspanin 37 n=1 Tax=Cyprinus carpio TaxID=7962 RepID=A0A8C1RCS2_CYPCA